MWDGRLTSLRPPWGIFCGDTFLVEDDPTRLSFSNSLLGQVVRTRAATQPGIVRHTVDFECFVPLDSEVLRDQMCTHEAMKINLCRQVDFS